MMPGRRKAIHRQLNTVDRLSDLPDSIVHHIISFLGTDEACRTSILSKRWTRIWSTGLILDFQPRLFIARDDEDFENEYVKSHGPYKTETIDRLVNFIETTMRRYFEENLSVRKFKLSYPTIDQEMVGRIDKWLGIAVQNQLEELSLSIIPQGLPSYELPMKLFLAKSLVDLKCCRVRVPYLQGLKLVSLQSLDLSEVDIDERILRDIIMSCPLKRLELRKCSGLHNISIPHYSRLESLLVETISPKDATIVLDTSSLQCFTYVGFHEDDVSPVIFNSASKKNLKELRFFGVVLDNTVDKLVSELSSIKEVRFYGCIMPENVRIASQTLVELGIHDCCDLINITIEAPQLAMFCYNGDLQLSSVISSRSICNAYLNLKLEQLDTRAFYRIKRLLRSKCCKFLSITLEDVPEIEFDEVRLRKINDGPYDVQELNLSVSCAAPYESSCRALIDGLLWSCRPELLSLSVTLTFDNTIVTTLLGILEKKVKCWKHPLKRIEVEGTNCSSLFGNWDLDLRLRLYW